VRAALGIALAVLIVAGCSDQGAQSPAAQRGRQVYLAQCTTCHNVDPSQPGPVGPPIKGASRDLLDAKLVRGAYPPGYTPKRPTSIMPPQPAVAPDIPAIAEFLK
jgi:mono/diheme cytochrome c family protein